MCNMLLCIVKKFILITILCSHHHVRGFIENYIFTKFDGLELYFKQTMMKLDYESNHEFTPLRPWRPDNLCFNLLGSRGYQIEGETTSNSIADENITAERMANVMYMNQFSFRDHLHTFPLLGGEQIAIRAYHCFDLNRTEKWKVIFKNEYLSGFLFENSANPQLPILQGLIDFYHVVPLIQNFTDDMPSYILKYNTGGYHDVGDRKMKQCAIEAEFQDSFEKLDHEAKDPLCSLNRILQFRLCSMGADAYHKSDERSLKYTYYRLRDKFIIEKPFFNFYHPKNNPDEACPKITIDFVEEVSVTEVQHHALFCDVSIQKIKYRFYLSYNTKEKNSMFIIIRKKNRFIIQTVLEVPLLHRLRMKDFDKIYSDEILERFQKSIKS